MIFDEQIFCPENGLNKNLGKFLNCKPFDFKLHGEFYPNDEKDNVIIKNLVNVDTQPYIDADDFTIGDFLTMYPKLQKKGLKLPPSQAKLYKVVDYILGDGYEVKISIFSKKNLSQYENQYNPNDIDDIMTFKYNYDFRKIKDNDILYFEVKFKEYPDVVKFKRKREFDNPIIQDSPLCDEWKDIRFKFHNLRKGKEYVMQPILYKPFRIFLTVENIKLLNV